MITIPVLLDRTSDHNLHSILLHLSSISQMSQTKPLPHECVIDFGIMGKIASVHVASFGRKVGTMLNLL